MTITAELADGRKLEFPDGTDPSIVQATVKKVMAQPSAAAKQIASDHITQGAQNFADELPVWQKLAAGFQSGVRAPFRGAGQRLREGIEAVTPTKMSELVTGKRDTLADTLGLPTQAEVDEVKRTETPLLNTGAGMVGNVAGNVGVTLPAMFVPGANSLAGATAIGAVTGAIQPTATGESVGQNMGYGAAGGAAGQTIGSLLGRAIRPVSANLTPEQQALVAAAKARGIPLDAADVTGSRPLKTIRDVLGQLPMTGDTQARIQAAKQAAYNRAVGGTFGKAEDALTPQVLSQARSDIGQRFTDLATRNSAQVDNAVLGKLAGVVDEANRFSTADVSRVVANYADEILSKVDANGKIPGQAYRALDSQMGRTMRSTTNGDIRHTVGQLRDELRAAMDASIAPADQAGWKEARRQYANLMTVAPLAAKSETGDVSGKTLLAAALRGNKSGAFTGGGDLGELGRIGRAFVAEQTPNSGTPQRTFMQNMLTSPNPLGVLYQYGLGGVSMPAQAVLNSGVGQAYLKHGALPISETQRKLLNALARGAGSGSGLAIAEQQ